MKTLLGVLGSIGLTASGMTAITLPVTTISQINTKIVQSNTNDNYSSILVDVSQNISVGSKNNAGQHVNATEDVCFSDLQNEFHMDYEAFLKAGFNINAIGVFKISTHLNPQTWSEVNFNKEESTSTETKYLGKLHHEAQNGWAKQKGDIKITLKVKKDNSMWIKTEVSAESYGSVSSTTTNSELKGISFK